MVTWFHACTNFGALKCICTLKLNGSVHVIFLLVQDTFYVNGATASMNS